MILRALRNIKNYFTDAPQEKDTIFKPLAKLPVEKLETMKPKDEITALTEHPFAGLAFYKTQRIKDRAELMHPHVKAIMLEMVEWVSSELNIHPIITETVSTFEEDKELKRVSSTHREGRAFDLRTRDWSPQHIEKFQKYFNAAYGYLGAITTSGKPLLLLHHDSGHGDHFHVQFNKSFSNSEVIARQKLT